MGDFLFVVFLFAFLGFTIWFLIKAIQFAINPKKALKINFEDFKIDLYFIKATELRKKDDDIQRGDCKLELNPEKFYIRQNDLVIENNLASVYRVEFWDYEGYTYFKIVMRSHIEYMFSSSMNEEIAIKFMILSLSKFFEHYGIKVENNSEVV